MGQKWVKNSDFEGLKPPKMGHFGTPFLEGYFGVMVIVVIWVILWE